MDASLKWNRENADRVRDRQYMTMYGITLDQYNGLVELQNGVCRLCGAVEKKKLSVDHDHLTGVVRGLLCNKCNTAIGMLGDTAEALLRVVDYIKGVGEFEGESITPGPLVRVGTTLEATCKVCSGQFQYVSKGGRLRKYCDDHLSHR